MPAVIAYCVANELINPVAGKVLVCVPSLCDAVQVLNGAVGVAFTCDNGVSAQAITADAEGLMFTYSGSSVTFTYAGNPLLLTYP